MDNLDVVTIRIEDPGGVVSRVVLQSGLGSGLGGSSSSQGGLVELVDLSIALRHKAHMNGLRVRLAFLEPKEGFCRPRSLSGLGGQPFP